MKGTKVGSYIIEGKLGEGGIGVVYSAKHDRMNRFLFSARAEPRTMGRRQALSARALTRAQAHRGGRLWAAVTVGLFTLGACSFVFEQKSEDPGNGDGDGGIVAPSMCEDWDPAPVHFDPCLIPAPTGSLELNLAGTYVLDTDTGELQSPSGDTSVLMATRELDPNGSPALLLSVDSFAVDGNAILRVKGSRSLVIASWTQVSVAGAIDVASATEWAGAGATPGPDCATNSAGDGAITPGTGGGGGGGGGFGSAGGFGGGADNGSSIGGGFGRALAEPPPMLRAGCRGGLGGGDNEPGLGGGAIEIAAAGPIFVDGAIYAGGAGGVGGDATLPGGGGGGGSGGWIGLDAPVIMVRGALTANGGGGGGGGGAGAKGNDGADATESSPAAGGPGANDGGRGGNGASVGELFGANGNDGLNDSGGGGGGGGAGFIVAFTESLTVQSTEISPEITQQP